MALHQLPQLVRRSKRVGRGLASRGAKSGRGQKGQRSRAGYVSRAGFEGGQTPLFMRLPKSRGSKQNFPSQVVKPTTITLAQLNRFTDNTIVGPGQLRKQGLLPHHATTIKLIGSTTITRKLTVRTHQISAGARQQIEAAGGKVEIIA